MQFKSLYYGLIIDIFGENLQLFAIMLLLFMILYFHYYYALFDLYCTLDMY